MHANCRKHQTTALLQTISISLKLATNSNNQLISSSRIQPEIPQAFLLLGCHRELFEVEDDVSKVMHPEAVGGRAVALPSVLGSLLHAPVCVGLQHTYCVRLKEKSILHLSAIIEKIAQDLWSQCYPQTLGVLLFHAQSCQVTLMWPVCFKTTAAQLCCCTGCLKTKSHRKLLRAVHSCKIRACCMSEGAHERMHKCLNIQPQHSIPLYIGMMRWVQEPMPPHGVGCHSQQNL